MKMILKKLHSQNTQNLKFKILFRKFKSTFICKNDRIWISIIAYYQKKQDCELAKVRFKRKFKNYWCNTSKTI
jgi:4-diphosphocytidyl-2-C-methyl-D-erythritol kinase